MERKAVAALLRARSFGRIYEASNGVTALEILAEHPIELMVTDLLLPPEAGLSLICRVRQAYPATRIIAVAGAAEETGGTVLEPWVRLETAARLGADRTLLKPLQPGELTDAVEALLSATR